ncbi:hypothetical protein B0J12DRAFT_650089 [Macrophomina phaseolina]|uniref:Secreted protein n=1 Tax=Macrophomina phaseolina TaxID=35725 RepID=A0ABQ8GM93_9PEZI|nr:hypothetical protein B0J12DRAFT_650089 [Macrophomina phaseolina]
MLLHVVQDPHRLKIPSAIFLLRCLVLILLSRSEAGIRFVLGLRVRRVRWGVKRVLDSYRAVFSLVNLGLHDGRATPWSRSVFRPLPFGRWG